MNSHAATDVARRILPRMGMVKEKFSGRFFPHASLRRGSLRNGCDDERYRRQQQVCSRDRESHLFD
jgi:hypothetical protein